MSLVEELTHEPRDMREQDPAETTYSIASFQDGVRVQIQSYGRAGRKGSTATQTLQFTEKSARQLVDILNRAFGF